MVDNGVTTPLTLPKALDLFDSFLNKTGLQKKNWSFMTCGDWDLKTCLQKEAKFKGISIKYYFKKWINIKKRFPIKKYRKNWK